MNFQLTENTKWPTALAILAGLAVIVFSYAKLFLGADFTDEAFYVAMPHRFAFGDRPFQDEWNIAQLASLLTYPFIRLYLYWVPDATGIILFARHLYFVFSLAMAYAIYRTLRKHFRLEVAALVSVTAIVVVPYNLPAPCYNTLGVGLFTIGLFLGGFSDSSRSRATQVGIVHGLAAFAYPTLIVSAAAYWVYLLSASKAKWFDGAKYAAAGILAAVALFLLYGIQWRSFQQALEYMMAFGQESNHGWDANKALHLFAEIARAASYKYLLLLNGVALWFFARKNPQSTQRKIAAAFSIVFFPVLLFYCTRSSKGGLGISGFLLYHGFLAPLYYGLFLRGRAAWHLLVGVWGPSLVAALVLCWSSNSGAHAAALGAMGANLVGLLFAVEALRGLLQAPVASGPTGRGALQQCSYGIMASLPVVLFLLVNLYSGVRGHMEDRHLDLRTRFTNGPFAGLWTTKAKQQYWDQISSDLKPHLDSATQIVFIPHFPAGYLISSLKPYSPSVWSTCSPSLLEGCRPFYAARSVSGTIAVRIKNLFYHSERTDPFGEEMPEPFSIGFKKIVTKPDYDIYRAE